MDTEERAFLQGQVIQRLDDLVGKVDAMGEDFRLFKVEAYGRINKNSLDIARQRGILVALGVIAGIAGGFLRSFFGR